MVSVHVLEQALRGALVAGGGATLLQTLLARKLERPGSVALSLATFVGIFRLLEDAESKKGKDEETSSPRAAAIAAAAALAVLDAKRRGFVVSLACAEAIITLGQRVPGINGVENVEFLVGMVVYTQLVYTWIYRPDVYSPSQLSALDRFTLSPKTVLKAMREQFPSGTLVSRCDVWHPHEPSCSKYHVQDFVRGLPQLMRLYFPIYLVTAVLLKWKRWVRGPRPSVAQTALQFLRTSVSLKLSSQLGVVGSCYLPVADHVVATYLSGMLTTLYLVVESEKRRASAVKSAALYVLCTSGTWTARRLQLGERARHAYQFALAAAAFAALFTRPATQSPQLMRLLYGRAVAPTSTTAVPGTQTQTPEKPRG